MDRQFWKGAAVGGAAVVIAMAGRFVSIYGVDTVLTNREYAEKLNVLTVIVDFIPVMEIYRTLLPIGLALGIGIGLVGSFLTTRKHLKV